VGRTGGARWLCFAVVAISATALLGCATTSRGAPATPSPEDFAPAPIATSSNSGASAESPIRWGYDPRKNNREVDPPAHFEGLPPGYRIETFVTGITQPTAIAFTADGRMLVAQQSGAIRVVDDGVLQREPFFDVPVYTPAGPEGFTELGLVGMTVGPDEYVYVYYTSNEPVRRTVLARIPDDDGLGADLTEIFSLDAAPVCCHIAGSLRFAPDGTLFVTVGDHQMEPEAQNISGPYGGVLRINPDGSVPADNPFVGDANADPRRYSYGLRNPFDLAIDPRTGRIFATENGYIGQDAIVELKAGANYGWPGSSLAVPLAQIEPPLLFYNQTIGPSGMEFYSGNELPWLDGSLLFCHFHRGGALHRITFDFAGGIADDAVIATGCTSDVLTGIDGFVYFLDYLSGTVYRIARGEGG